MFHLFLRSNYIRNRDETLIRVYVLLPITASRVFLKRSPTNRFISIAFSLEIFRVVWSILNAVVYLSAIASTFSPSFRFISFNLPYIFFLFLGLCTRTRSNFLLHARSFTTISDYEWLSLALSNMNDFNLINLIFLSCNSAEGSLMT